MAWDNLSTLEDNEEEAVVRAAAGLLVLPYLPTYTTWHNPIEMLWRQCHREVIRCELFESVKSLLTATGAFFERYGECPNRILSIIGALPT